MNTILFIHCGSFSNINASLVLHLQKQFPNYVIEEFDVYKIIVPKYLKSFTNIIYLIKEYGLDFITRQKSRYSFWEWAFVTSYMYKLIQIEIQKHVKKNQYIFTFQTQSLFDASTPGIPHFVYTDSTALAVLDYPNINVNAVIKSKAWMKLEQQIYKNATFNFTFSTNQTKSIINQYNINPEKVKCVYAGSNIEFSRISNNNNSKKILFVGVNWERKGGPVLLKAFQKVLLTHPDAKLIIVGCSKQLILINNNITELKNCEIYGRIPLHEINRYFEQASLYCMPTRIEPFGIVFIEAMMYRLPIIASNIGALPDLVEHGVNGYLYDMNDVENIANSINQLLNDNNLCKNMGDAGYNKAIKNYTWENTTLLMSQLIKENL